MKVYIQDLFPEIKKKIDKILDKIIYINIYFMNNIKYLYKRINKNDN